jgi:hypothetical protein
MGCTHPIEGYLEGRSNANQHLGHDKRVDVLGHGTDNGADHADQRANDELVVKHQRSYAARSLVVVDTHKPSSPEYVRQLPN